MIIVRKENVNFIRAYGYNVFVIFGMNKLWYKISGQTTMATTLSVKLLNCVLYRMPYAFGECDEQEQRANG